MKEELHERLLRTAESMFMRYGTKSVSMDDISREMGVSKKTLYKYCESKKDLVHQVIQHHHDQEQNLLKELRNTSSNAIEEMVRLNEYVSHMLKSFRPTIIYDLKKYHKSSWELMESLHNRFVYDSLFINLEKGKSEGLYREDVDSDLISRLYTAMTLFIVENHQQISKERRLEAIFQTFTDYHLHAIMTETGKDQYYKHTNNES
jgi:AcrR family transcriptional regulator